MFQNVSRCFYLLIILLFTACAPAATVNPELRRAAAKVQILKLEEIKSREYSIISEIMGLSCGRQLGSDPSVEAAREKLRIEAAKLGADAVLNVICEETGVNWAHNCWKTIQCRGDAIKWK